jgi:hypothetical protein
MLSRLKNWLTARASQDDSPSPVVVGKRDRSTVPANRPTATRAARPEPEPEPEPVDTDNDLSGKIETVGPGKNVLIRKKFLREHTGTDETLTIFDDSMVDSGEETGIDPYNTGGFDRSRNWDKRFGK